jgi:acyl dehydratase
MSTPTFDALAIGDRLAEHVCGPITRTTLALFAGGSGDHNPIHIDIDFAKGAGFQDVFAHGMLSMAYLAQMVAMWAPPHALRALEVRYQAMTPVNSTIICSAEVVNKFEFNGERRVRLKIAARLIDGLQTVAGEAVIALA